MFICIAGKNKWAIDAVNVLIKKKISKNKILALPISTDTGKDSWQPSFKKYIKNKKIKIINLEYIYNIQNIILFSFEYDKIINIKNIKSDKLFNFHFSLLPKYRGCHTNYLQILRGEKYSGVTLHKIDSGIDTGDIVDQHRFKIKINDTALNNYERLMKCSVDLFKKNSEYTRFKRDLSKIDKKHNISSLFSNRLGVKWKKMWSYMVRHH